VLALKPADVDALLSRARAKRAGGDPAGALADLTEALRLSPRNADALYRRGNVHFDLQQYDHAVADYTRAVDLDAKHIGARYGRGGRAVGKGTSRAPPRRLKSCSGAPPRRLPGPSRPRRGLPAARRAEASGRRFRGRTRDQARLRAGKGLARKPQHVEPQP